MVAYVYFCLTYSCDSCVVTEHLVDLNFNNIMQNAGVQPQVLCKCLSQHGSIWNVLLRSGLSTPYSRTWMDHQ